MQIEATWRMQAPALALTLRPGENAEEMLRAELEQQLSYQVCVYEQSCPIEEAYQINHLQLGVRSNTRCTVSLC